MEDVPVGVLVHELLHCTKVGLAGNMPWIGRRIQTSPMLCRLARSRSCLLVRSPPEGGRETPCSPTFRTHTCGLLVSCQRV